MRSDQSEKFKIDLDEEIRKSELIYNFVNNSKLFKRVKFNPKLSYTINYKFTAVPSLFRDSSKFYDVKILNKHTYVMWCIKNKLDECDEKFFSFMLWAQNNMNINSLKTCFCFYGANDNDDFLLNYIDNIVNRPKLSTEALNALTIMKSLNPKDLNLVINHFRETPKIDNLRVMTLSGCKSLMPEYFWTYFRDNYMERYVNNPNEVFDEIVKSSKFEIIEGVKKGTRSKIIMLYTLPDEDKVRKFTITFKIPYFIKEDEYSKVC